MIFRQILSISRRIHRNYNELLKETGLGSGQIFILLAVIDKPGLNQDSLCRMLDIDKSTVAKGMKTLLNKRYIIRIRDKKDMRNWILFPSKTGEKLSVFIKETLKNENTKINELFKESEINEFDEYLSRLNSYLEK